MNKDQLVSLNNSYDVFSHQYKGDSDQIFFFFRGFFFKEMWQQVNIDECVFSHQTRKFAHHTKNWKKRELKKIPKDDNLSLHIQDIGVTAIKLCKIKHVAPNKVHHYNDVIMGAMASQITSITIVYSTVYTDTDQRKHQSPASLAIVRGIHRGPVNSPHKWPVTRKMFPFDDVIMYWTYINIYIYTAAGMVHTERLGNGLTARIHRRKQIEMLTCPG